MPEPNELETRVKDLERAYEALRRVTIGLHAELKMLYTAIANHQAFFEALVGSDTPAQTRSATTLN